MRVLHLCLLYSTVFTVAAVLSASCIDVEYPTAAFQCDPHQKDPCPSSGSRSWTCCSDDPASAPGRLPDFNNSHDGGRYGEPLFSGSRNSYSRSGICLDVSQIAGGLLNTGAVGCPIPCNPTWKRADVDDVCGDSGFCCQTVEITENDCVLVDGCYVPASGEHIGSGDEDFKTANNFPTGDPWAAATHDTHQDPGGTGCAEIASTTDDFSVKDCYEKLSVANQRGFCFTNACNLDAVSDYQDACERLNAESGLSCDDRSDQDDAGPG